MAGRPLAHVHRLRWFKEARFGMFITWGLYSQLGRWEWTMHNERIPIREYEKLADTWQPKPRCMREWARLARDAGMKYMVMTTKHHEGFCLWDSAQTGYNAARRGPGRDLVREYVEACREFGLKVGLYYSLMDWHHPDGMRAANDTEAARRFREFSHGCVRELCSNYGPVDILWYDNNWPALADGGWQPESLNAMARQLQPRILINNRSGTPEDFGTPEGHVTAENDGRAWEACMTMNGAWSYVPSPDWVSVRQILEMLRTAAAGDGNVLLDIGPKADGSVPREASVRLRAVGRWLAQHGDALYGRLDRADGLSLMNTGNWTLKGKTAYFWASRWPDTGEIVFGRWKGKVKQATLLTTGKPVRVEQVGSRLFLRGIPVANPDSVAQVPVIKLECTTPPSIPTDWSYEDVGVRGQALVGIA
jgi:alpha-L-fucosidase